MKRLLGLLLAALFLMGAAAAEDAAAGDGYYDLAQLVSLDAGETAVLLNASSWYSGDAVYRAKTQRTLPGSCVLHCVSVMLTNARGSAVTAQEVAQANNAGVKAASWSANVTWSRVEKQFVALFGSESLVAFDRQLRLEGVARNERRQRKMAYIASLAEQYGRGVGVLVHFNSSGSINGGGRRHGVVVLGYIMRDGRVTDLLISDSATPAPQGACVRMSRSVVPHSMLGDRGLKNRTPEEALLLAMDGAVSCRYLMGEDDPDAQLLVLSAGVERE